MQRFICLNCRTTREAANAALGANACPCCQGAMTLVDPAAAEMAILKAPVEPIRRPRAWQMIRRELIIGLVWGLVLAALVIYPLRVETAYQDADGKVYNYPPGIIRDEAGERVFQPGTSALGRGQWFGLLVVECGSVVAVAGSIGVLVGIGKWIRRR